MLIEGAYMEEVMKLAEYLEDDSLKPIAMTDHYSTNSKLFLSRNSLAGKGVGEGGTLDDPPG